MGLVSLVINVACVIKFRSYLLILWTLFYAICQFLPDSRLLGTVKTIILDLHMNNGLQISVTDRKNGYTTHAQNVIGISLASSTKSG
jgi:hypothetical protein